MVEANHAGARASGLGQLRADQITGLDQFINRSILDGAVAVANNALATRNRPLDGVEVCFVVSHISVSSGSRC